MSVPDLRARLTALLTRWCARGSPDALRCADELEAVLRYTPPADPRLAALVREMQDVTGEAASGPYGVHAYADRLAALLREPPAATSLLTRADVEALWEATFDGDDWTHIVTFANAVRALAAARAAAPEEKADG